MSPAAAHTARPICSRRAVRQVTAVPCVKSLDAKHRILHIRPASRPHAQFSERPAEQRAAWTRTSVASGTPILARESRSASGKSAAPIARLPPIAGCNRLHGDDSVKREREASTRRQAGGIDDLDFDTPGVSADHAVHRLRSEQSSLEQLPCHRVGRARTTHALLRSGWASLPSMPRHYAIDGAAGRSTGGL
jgi:hypothetical protein